MSGFRDDVGLRIEALERDGPARDWTVETVDGRVLFRCQSHEEAMNMRALVVRLSREETLGLKVSSATVTAGYVDRTGLNSANSRFCDWALLQLGQVAITTSADKPGARFIVTSRNGRSGKGRTLAAALFKLVNGDSPACTPQRGATSGCLGTLNSEEMP
jgi:hypothetical protein